MKKLIYQSIKIYLRNRVVAIFSSIILFISFILLIFNFSFYNLIMFSIMFLFLIFFFIIITYINFQIEYYVRQAEIWGKDLSLYKNLYNVLDDAIFVFRGDGSIFFKNWQANNILKILKIEKLDNILDLDFMKDLNYKYIDLSSLNMLSFFKDVTYQNKIFTYQIIFYSVSRSTEGIQEPFYLIVIRDVTYFKQQIQENETKVIKKLWERIVSGPIKVLEGYSKQLNEIVESLSGNILVRSAESDTFAKLDLLTEKINRDLFNIKVLSSAIELNIEEYDVRELFKEFQEYYSKITQIIDKDIEFIIEIEEKYSHVLIDKEFLKRILENLVFNAIEHSHSNKIKVKVGVGLIPDKSFSLYIKVVSVGYYINDEDYLLNLYYTKDPNFHIGIGLNAVNKMVKAFNGDIEIDNSSDEGFSITVYLPIISRKL